MSIATKEMTDEERSAAARAMGSARTPAKAAAAARNSPFKKGHTLATGRKHVPLSEIECAIKAGKQVGQTCPGGDLLEGHHWSCPRGQAIIRRKAQGRDPRTGQKSDA